MPTIETGASVVWSFDADSVSMHIKFPTGELTLVEFEEIVGRIKGFLGGSDDGDPAGEQVSEVDPPMSGDRAAIISTCKPSCACEPDGKFLGTWEHSTGAQYDHAFVRVK